jgi:tetraacyldisaccharide 4'-kinase
MEFRSAFFQLGRPLSPLYGGMMSLRALLYRRGILASERLPVPVICIGNLGMGGTGKTPLVMAVTRLLQACGRRPALVSRGYGGRAAAAVNVVADGHRVFLDAGAAGDEPRLLADSLPGVPVLTGKRRAMAGRQAIERFTVDTVVLDDGFQHLGLARDLDLVLFSAHGLLQNSRVFPGGDLRESFSALERAHGVVITGVDAGNLEKATSFKKFLQERLPLLPVFMSGFRPLALCREPAGEICDFDAIRDKKLGAFCGVATPESFRQTLATAGYQLAAFKTYRDHYPYAPSDLRSLVRWAKQQGGSGLITTEKDFVKIKPYCGEVDFPIFVLRVELSLEQDFCRFLEKEITSWGVLPRRSLV